MIACSAILPWSACSSACLPDLTTPPTFRLQGRGGQLRLEGEGRQRADWADMNLRARTHHSVLGEASRAYLQAWSLFVFSGAREAPSRTMVFTHFHMQHGRDDKGPHTSHAWAPAACEKRHPLPQTMVRPMAARAGANGHTRNGALALYGQSGPGMAIRCFQNRHDCVAPQTMQCMRQPRHRTQ